MKRKQLLVIPLLLLALTLSSCIHVRGNSKAPVPPKVTAATYNAILATTNDSIAKGLVVANQTGILKDAETAEYTSYQFSIAKADRELTTIIDRGPVKGDADHIKSLIQTITDAAVHLSSSSALGVKNPTSQATFQSDASLIKVMADNIVTALQSAGVLQ